MDEALLTTPRGRPLPCDVNLLRIFRHHLELSYDARFHVPLIQSPPWDEGSKKRRICELDATKCTSWLAEQYQLPATFVTVGSMLRAAAKQHSFDPVRDYFDSLSWDGIPRLDTWLTKYLGCKDTELTQAQGAAWMLSVVARTYRPGCKADYVLTLAGRPHEDIFRILAVRSEWFVRLFRKLQSSLRVIQGPLIVELSKKNSLACISAEVDYFYRPKPWEHRRTCVFGLMDDSPPPNRRFWRVKPGRKMNIKALRTDLNALYAEAKHRYLAGEQWWLEPELEQQVAF